MGGEEGKGRSWQIHSEAIVIIQATDDGVLGSRWRSGMIRSGKILEVF